MAYRAIHEIHYITTDGDPAVAEPGTIFADLPADTAAWLLERGAVATVEADVAAVTMAEPVKQAEGGDVAESTETKTTKKAKAAEPAQVKSTAADDLV